MKDVELKKLIDSDVEFSCGYGAITIPLIEMIDIDQLELIVEECDDKDDLRYELEDLAYEYFTSNMNIIINGLQ